MGKFEVTVYDRVVRRYRKTFTADNAADAREAAEYESIEDDGWVELYDEMSSSQAIESVEPVEWEED